MAPRRRAAQAKKKGKSKAGDPSTPTDEQWGSMTPYGTFIVQDDDEVEYAFKQGQFATMLPSTHDADDELELYDYWVGKIIEIRACDENVWVRVQWLYSAADVAGIIKSFNPEACGKYERILSNHHDYVSSSSFNAVVTVKFYKEDDPDQEPIDPNEFYYRYTLERGLRSIKPKPGVQTCICKQPYSPDDADATSLMHFCPRPGCRKAYHSSCLIKAKHQEPKTNRHDRDLRLLASSPDSDATISLADLATSEPPRKKQKRRGRPKKDSHDNGALALTSLDDLLAPLPADLVRIAQQPIVKGAATKSGGVTGNTKAVVSARRMVYDAVAGTPVSDDWDDELGVEEAIVRVDGRRVIPAFICPQCEGPI